jgi:NADPH2:quinone reductase
MKAILIRTTGGPSVLEHVDLPDPVPGPGEVLVRASAIGVNRPDVLIRKGEYPWMPPLPTIPASR